MLVLVLGYLCLDIIPESNHINLIIRNGNWGAEYGILEKSREVWTEWYEGWNLVVMAMLNRIMERQQIGRR